MAKWIRAPEWFLELENEKVKAEKKIEELLGLEEGWFTEQRRKFQKDRNALKLVLFVMKQHFDEKDKITQEKVKKILLFLDSLEGYMWKKFRFENLDNEFGMAERFEFDAKNKRIYIKKSLSQMIKEAAEKIMKKLSLDFF